MPISRSNADRCLRLLWEYGCQVQAPEQVLAYRQAISSVHAYLTDVLPAALPCVRAQAQHGVVEIFPDQNARVQDIDLSMDEGEKLGIVLDCIDVDGSVSTASPIVVALLRPHSVAAKDGRLARGDQVISINGHTLSQVSLQRARWLLDSAERSLSVTLSIIASGLMAALKHSISRQNMLSLTPRTPRSSYHDSINTRRVKRLLTHKTEQVQTSKKPSPKEPVKLSSRTSLKAGYTPSIGSQHDSNYSLVSSTVEAAAFKARSSMRSSRIATKVEVTLKKRKVRKMHIMKGTSGLGLRIIGGKGSNYGDIGIFVSQLEEGGAASNDGRLHPGDELLMVDGKSLVGLSHDEAVGILKATQKLVQLVVATEHMEEGESVNSSLQSIPEMFANKINLARMVDPHAIIAAESMAIAPEASLAPQKNAFQQSVEMQNMTGDILSPKHPLPESMETRMDNFDVRAVRVVRSEGKPLGLRIRQGSSERTGKKSIFVRAIDPHGIIGRSKQLHEGDELLEVNGISLEESTQQEAIAILTGAQGEMLTLQVASSHVQTEQKREVLLHKISGQPLGIKLASTDILTGNSSQLNTMAVFVENIAIGSPAHTSGKLSVGDQLVSVNDMSVLGMRVEQVKGLLSSIPGAKIKLVVLSGPQLDNWNDSAEKTRAEQHTEDCSDDTAEAHPDIEMELTAAHPELPLSPPPALECVPPIESSSSSTVDSDDTLPANVRKKIVQSRQPRPGSNIYVSGNIDQPSLFLQSLTEPSSIRPSNWTESAPSVSSSSPQSATDSPSVLHLAPPPPPPPPELPLPPSPSSSSAQPPAGFVSMEFKLKKRPRAGIGFTLAASEGLTKGLFMVRRIAASGVAAKDGRILIGDRLVSVNGASLFSQPHAAVLQALNEANKEVELVVWRDPSHTLASSSTYSWGSYSNLSGSHSSLLPEEVNEVGSPSSIGARKHQYSRGLASPAARNSPLAARFSYAGVPTTPPPRDVKRWSDGDVLAGYSKSSENLATRVISDDELLLPPDVSPTQPADGLDALPPDVPNSTPPPGTLTPEESLANISIDLLPELPSNLTPPESPIVPFFEASPSEPSFAKLFPAEYPEAPPTLPPEAPPTSPPEAPPTLPPEAPLTLSPEAPPTSPPEVTPTGPSEEVVSSGDLQLADNRPPSLQVPRGARQENLPFEIELKKGIFSLGVTLSNNQMGMLAITTLSSRSVISQDGNIKVGDILLSINDESMIGVSEKTAEACLKGLPRGPFKLTVMTPPKDVTGKGVSSTSQSELPPVTSIQPLQEPDLTASAALQSESKVTDEEESETLQHSTGTPLEQSPCSSSQHLHSLPEPNEDSQYKDEGVKADSTNDISTMESTNVTCAGSVEVLLGTASSGSIEDLPNTDPNRKANLISEDSIIVELERAPGERLGIRLVGGTDNPNLQHVHVRQVVPSGAAARDGRIKTGDRITAVNDQSLNGLSNKQALQKLKDAGDHVTLKIARKVGRRASRATTPLASARHSIHGSGDTSCVESRRMSPQRSPRGTLRRGHGAGSSDEGSREGSRGTSPQHNRRHRRRQSVSAQGEVLTFRGNRSTLPRKIKGAREGVHLVELHKGPTGLGLQLQGSVDATTPIFVKAVLRGGPAYKSDKIHVGDEVIEVNGIPFENMSQQDALKTVKNLPQGKVSMILRDKPGFED